MNQHYVIYDLETGRILQGCTAGSPEAALTCADATQGVLDVDASIDNTAHYVDAGQLVAMPARPSDGHRFDYATKAWVDPRTLVDLQAVLTRAATAHRWVVETGGITLPGGIRVRTEKADQDRVTSVIVNASTAGMASVDFKAQSGWVTLTVAQVQGIATAIALHVQACFSAERAHHEAIAALATLAAAQAYDVTTDWPT